MSAFVHLRKNVLCLSVSELDLWIAIFQCNIMASWNYLLFCGTFLGHFVHTGNYYERS